MTDVEMGRPLWDGILVATVILFVILRFVLAIFDFIFTIFTLKAVLPFKWLMCCRASRNGLHLSAVLKPLVWGFCSCCVCKLNPFIPEFSLPDPRLSGTEGKFLFPYF